jgi:hypothetical protein
MKPPVGGEMRNLQGEYVGAFLQKKEVVIGSEVKNLPKFYLTTVIKLLLSYPGI